MTAKHFELSQLSLTSQPANKENFKSKIAATINNNTGNHWDYSKTKILYWLAAKSDSINTTLKIYKSTAKLVFRNLHSIGSAKLIFWDNESNEWPQATGQHWVSQSHRNLKVNKHHLYAGWTSKEYDLLHSNMNYEDNLPCKCMDWQR